LNWINCVYILLFIRWIFFFIPKGCGFWASFILISLLFTILALRFMTAFCLLALQLSLWIILFIDRAFASVKCSLSTVFFTSAAFTIPISRTFVSYADIPLFLFIIFSSLFLSKTFSFKSTRCTTVKVQTLLI
jgi:hypothetical protein